MDLLYLGLVLAFFIATAVLVTFCDALREEK